MKRRGPGARRPEQRDEIRVFGLRAAQAIAAERPGDIVRMYLTEERLRDFRTVLERLARDRKAYHVVGSDELDRVAGSLHHEGVCVLAKPRPEQSLAALTAELAGQPGPVVVVVLDRVENPNNLGAILRVGAHFGVRAVVYTTPDGAPVRSSAILRTAEGAAERVDLVFANALWDALEALGEAGLSVVGTSGRAEETLWSAALPARMALVLGSEGEGIDPGTLEQLPTVVQIPGTGAVESLNVSCAASVILAERWRTRSAPAGHHPPRSPRRRPR